MRLFALNLRAGGNAATIPRILQRASYLDAGALVFSEYRDNAAGARLRSEAERRGFSYQASSAAKRGNGVLVASTRDFRAVPNPFGMADDEYPGAILQAAFGDLDLYGVYLPGQDRKRPHLRCLIALAARSKEIGASAICIGDFNSGRNETDIEINARSGEIRDAFSTADLYAELETYWTEAWAYLHPGEYDFSWYPFRLDPAHASRSGWRIDKAFLSPALLPRLRNAKYDHTIREDRLSDHSGLIVDIGDAVMSDAEAARKRSTR